MYAVMRRECRCQMEVWVAEIRLADKTVLASTTHMSAAGAKSWLLSQLTKEVSHD